MIKSPISRYPGSKRLHLKELLADAAPVDAVIEPFAGAAHYSISRLQNGVTQAFLGEADPTVRSLYEVWRQPRLHDFFTLEIEAWSEILGVQPDESMNPAQFDVEKILAGDIDSSSDAEVLSAAAAGAILRQLTFGGVIRCSDTGKQNAPVVKGQLKKLWRWEANLEGSEVARRFNVQPNYIEAIAAFKNSDLASAEALIDPPYYAPLAECPRRQTPAYWGHKPHAKETLELCLNAFEQCLSDERIRRVVVTNYVSDELHDGLSAIASRHNQQLQFFSGNTLKTMQRSTGKVGDGAKQGFWQVIR